ncbi:HAD-IC family P-type ATPase [Paraneptunicella aestuarii]|uniref:cation-translocating P-type ATPase n=1 Tax=Paraneptunicella aestuarii TaxID=2831148 RepID=UPI001E506953|nr:HAD-IC family P-type ATPase [Paraneptunicella aestuarii]UAA40580.1 HAD-IC family P-type ATPase [Paraneptunicella aestuarii]
MQGLSTQEAQQRLQQYGVNKLPDKAPPSAPVIFIRQFKSPFIYVLLAAAIVSYFLGQTINSFFILLVLFLNAFIGTIQEFSAAKAAEALKNMVPFHASVYRDGTIVRLPTEELVPGDLVQLVSGDKVPADIHLTRSKNLIVDESMLTGESQPQQKAASDPLQYEQQGGQSAEYNSQDDSHPITERKDVVFAGTIVTHGRCEGIVTDTGVNTEIGHIAHDVTGTEDTKPPLLLRLEKFTVRITYSIVILIVILFLITLARGDDLSQVFLMGVALAVSAIPEGLPAAITVALAIGMRRMANKGVIVRKLVAVESLGSCTYIASDKTGTLTVNEMTIRQIATPDGKQYSVTGEGLDLHGEIKDESGQLANGDSGIKPLIIAGTLANESTLECVDGEWSGNGDHVDLAFLVACNKYGLDHRQILNSNQEISNIPYESENAYSASVRNVDGLPTLFIKGSVEKLLEFSTLAPDNTPLHKEAVTQQMQQMAKQGYRVMGLGYKPLQNDGMEPQQELCNIVFLGIVGMLDPLRPQVQEAIAQCREADIQVAMVTGDHPNTAQAIAKEMGLQQADQPLTGAQISALSALVDSPQKAMSEEEFDREVAKHHVFARVEPRQKKRLVDSLKHQGEFVAVTGDGVNDAPALHAAHVGVAMGKRGTDVARESSDLIITDDNFASIVEGVKQGRIVYNNIRKVVFLLISTGAAEITLFILSILMGLPLPLLPIQLLWLNLVTNGLQDVALAFEPEEGNELKRKPRHPDEPVFDRLMIERVIINAIVMGCLAFAVFKVQLSLGLSIEAARNITLLQMVLFENIHVFNSRSEHKSIFKQAFLGNPFLIFGMFAAQAVHIMALYTDGISDILQLQPVTFNQWVELLGIALILIIVDEVHKLWRKHRPL